MKPREIIERYGEENLGYISKVYFWCFFVMTPRLQTNISWQNRLLVQSAISGKGRP
jgi:hypothetical protein